MYSWEKQPAGAKLVIKKPLAISRSTVSMILIVSPITIKNLQTGEIGCQDKFSRRPPLFPRFKEPDKVLVLELEHPNHASDIRIIQLETVVT